MYTQLFRVRNLFFFLSLFIIDGSVHPLHIMKSQGEKRKASCTGPETGKLTEGFSAHTHTHGSGTREGLRLPSGGGAGHFEEEA